MPEVGGPQASGAGASGGAIARGSMARVGGATVVTAQLPVSDWHEYLGGGRVADAILDRLVHNSHRIELNSTDSMRKEYSDLKHGGQSVK